MQHRKLYSDQSISHANAQSCIKDQKYSKTVIGGNLIRIWCMDIHIFIYTCRGVVSRVNHTIFSCFVTVYHHFTRLSHAGATDSDSDVSKYRHGPAAVCGTLFSTPAQPPQASQPEYLLPTSDSPAVAASGNSGHRRREGARKPGTGPCQWHFSAGRRHGILHCKLPVYDTMLAAT